MYTRQLSALALLMALSVALSACATPSATAAPELAPVAQATATAVAPAAQPTAPTGAPLTSSDLVFGVSAIGTVIAEHDSELVFQVAGTIETVNVEEGDQVKKGDVLAVLDTRRFDQSVRDAEAALAAAKADLAALTEDPTSEEARAAQANLDAAVAQLQQTQGAVTESDVAAAQAALTQANEALADLLDGSEPEDIQQAVGQRDAAQANLDNTRTNLSHARTQAQIGLEQATIGLQTQRDNLSHAKTQAEIGAQQASLALEQAQTAYSEAYWDWQYAQGNGRQPSDIELQQNPTLSDFGTQAVYNRFRQAEIALNTAQQQLESAQKQLEQARQNEITGIQTAERSVQSAQDQVAQTAQNEVSGVAAAEAQVVAAQASVDRVLKPAEPAAIAAAQAQVASAQANLNRLQGQQRAGQLSAAEAQVAAAQANLDRLYGDPTASAAARSEAFVARAEAALAQAKLNREDAELQAPFDGEVAVVNIDPGDVAVGPAGQPAIRVVDLSNVYVEVDVSDADIARIKLGQKATVTADALPGQSFDGSVTFISPTATVRQNITTYLVRIRLDDATGLKIGMAVTADLQTQ